MIAGNPLLKPNTFDGAVRSPSEVMTINGTVNKTLILLGLCASSAYYAWYTPGILNWLLPIVLASFVLALVTVFKKHLAPMTAPIYVLLQGLTLGAITQMYEVRMPGIALQAVTLTFGTLGLMLFFYRYNIIRVTDKLRSGIIIATGSILVVYLISMIMRFFGTQIPMIHDSGPIGIGFSLFVVGIAAFNLLLDFDTIERATKTRQAPPYMEWFGAFILMVTLIWLYLEILRLLGKLKARR